MEYDKFNNDLKFLHTKSLITDKKRIKDLEEKIYANQPLPENIEIEIAYTTYDKDNKPFHLYKMYERLSDKEIETLLKISEASSLKSISNTLLFFKTLSIISITATLIYVLILLL